MHPIIALRRVSSLERNIVNCLLGQKGAISQTTLIKGMRDPPSQPTVSRAVARLITRGIIVRTGRTKGSRLVLTAAARHFATPPQARLPLAFEPTRIQAYRPNVTAWLAPEFRARMDRAGHGVRGQIDASTYSRKIAERFVVDLSWASSRLEGNTYDFLDTEMLIRYGREADGHDRAEALMLLNHKRAITRLLECIGNGIPDAGEALRLHALMMNGLMDPGDIGRIRHHAIRINTSSYMPSDDRPELVRQQAMILACATAIKDPFESSFFLLAAISYLQAFGDGNKRMGRLLSNAPLLAAGMPPLSFMEIDRDAYILGLIDFYETANTDLLAESIVQSYEMTAPLYRASYFSQRLPRQIEIREGPRIADFIRSVVVGGMALRDIPDRIKADFKDLETVERDGITQIVRERLEGLNPAQAIIYDLEDDQVVSWLEGTAFTR